MKHQIDNNESIFLIDGPDPQSLCAKHFGITKRRLSELKARGSSVKIAQLIGIVKDGLITSNVIFQGAKRPLHYNGNQNGDKDKLFLIFKPKHDYDWSPSRDSLNEIQELPPPSDSVFVVVATPNRDVSFQTVDFWIESWTWLDESPSEPGFPIQHTERYDQRIQRPTT